MEFIMMSLYGKDMKDFEDYAENQDKFKTTNKWSGEMHGKDMLYYWLNSGEHYWRKEFEVKKEGVKIKTEDPTKIPTISPTEIETISPNKIETINPTKIETIHPNKINVESITTKSTDPVEEFDRKSNVNKTEINRPPKN
jgi:hypothetical protein